MNPSLTITAMAERANWNDCGSPVKKSWNVYWRRNMPGYHNLALADDGQMLSWWPFLFY